MRTESTLDLLLKLDSYTQPGIPIADFSRLFRKCAQCRVIMTRRVARQHRCAPSEVAVIDLTQDDDTGASRQTAIDLTGDSDND
jgi:hypothetical protein